MCVSMCVCLCMSVHVCKCMHMWKLEINVEVSSSTTLHPIFETKHLSAPGAHHSWLDWPTSQLPASACPHALNAGSKDTITPGFSLKAADLNWAPGAYASDTAPPEPSPHPHAQLRF